MPGATKAEGGSGDITQLSEICERAGVVLSVKVRERLVVYVESLLDWNKKHNLISRADTSNIWSRHILHSVIPLLMFRFPKNLAFVDIGTGGGLPGIPIAILRPDLQGVLVDSVRKKTEALRSIIETVGITNLRVVTERVESPSFMKQFRSEFDLAFARAVAPLPELVTWTRGLLSKPRKTAHTSEGAKEIIPPAIIALKGGDLSSEIVATKRAFPNLSIAEHSISTIEGVGEFFTDKKVIVVR